MDGVEGKEGPGVEGRLAAMPLPALTVLFVIAVSGRSSEEAVKEVSDDVEAWKRCRAGL